jgi:hypothetical protein
MPEFSFYCAKDDHARLLSTVLSDNHLRFIPDTLHSYPVGDSFESVTAVSLSSLLEGSRSLFLVGEFTSNGIPFKRAAYGPKAGYYTVDESGMGPVIRFTFPTWFIEDGVFRVVPGHIQYHASYTDTSTEESYPASAALRTAYGKVKTTLQASLQRITFASQIWITPLALSLMGERRVAILDSGKWVTGPIDGFTLAPCKWYRGRA